MVREYRPAALRMDTAPYFPIDFLREFREAAGVPIYGEVTTSNWTYLQSFVKPPLYTDTRGAIDAVTHFSLLGGLRQGFCGSEGEKFGIHECGRAGVQKGSSG